MGAIIPLQSEWVEMALSPVALATLNVVTNAVYFYAAYFMFVRRIYPLSAWLLVAGVASSIYHACSGFHVFCFAAPVRSLQTIDHITANLAIAETFLFLSTYDVVSLKKAHHYARASGISLHHTPAQTHLPDRALIRSRFADFLRAFYTFAIILAAIVALDTIWEYAISIGIGVVYLIASSLVGRRFKWRNHGSRYSIPLLIVAGFALAGTGALFFAPDRFGDDLHPVWHLGSAITALFILSASSYHLRIYTMAELYASPA